MILREWWPPIYYFGVQICVYFLCSRCCMLRYTYVINKTRIALTASFWKVKIGHLQTNVPKIGIPMLKAPLYRPLVISYHSSWNLLFPGAWLEGGEVSPALFQNLKKSALNLGKNVLTRFIYRFNFSFKMLF